LASVAGELVAFAWFAPPQRGVARLEYLYVRPAHRRRSVARRLVDAVAEELRPRGATHLVLEVVATNDAAQATWKALGFELIEYRLAAPI
jgi:ribosomal-protein-alanine N-acetyltransferase